MNQEIHVGNIETLRHKPVVVRGERHNIVVFAEGDQCFAVDNRCPHMGFPLSRGSVQDGILTCHWHQARFDLSSGCTFDLWADDVLRFAVRMDQGEIYVSSMPCEQRDATFYRRRLIQGLEQNVGLVQAKSLLSILEADSPLDELLGDIVLFAGANLNQITEGMTRLGCIANLYSRLDLDVAYQGLFYALRQIAQESVGATPHRYKSPLAGDDYDQSQLKAWLSQWVRTRHLDGTERTLLTGLKVLSEASLADLLFSAASERLYANGGHVLESCNKAFEFGERLGPEHMDRTLALLADTLRSARGQEESTNWHHPINLIGPLAEVDRQLPEILAANRGTREPGDCLLNALAGDDPIAMIDAMLDALKQDVSASRIAREVCYAAALRLARFATSNEVTDWFNPQHTFIYCHAACRAVERSATPQVVRSVFHGAVASYMDRFLNVPPARLPSERHRDISPRSGEVILDQLLQRLDQRADIDETAALVADYVALDLPFNDLVNTLTFATIREDLDFHCLQVLDAAVQQCERWEDPVAIENILVGVTRNLAAHCPTRRAGQQTARIAAKLQRGEAIYEDD
ncbi:MAG: Rieske (2Fe-2S) protein [Proteobacteria bacterium]|nr:Rieske (2Fe-2S) protein [Pseudomonadota bacterium]MDA1300552.1 Rieske (2Fe-2S) protein [Pseudomonadota bacterium]